MATPSTACIPKPSSIVQALPASGMNDLVRAGELLAQSGMFGINNAGAGFVVAATCHQQGISLMEFQRTYHIIENKPSMRADAMVAEFRKRGGKVKIIENSTERAAIETEFEGQKLAFAFTMEDARRTGDCFKGDGKTLKHNWEHRADDMLWARCVSRAIRRLCPEIVAGLYTPEEVSDFDDRPAAPRAVVEIKPEVVTERVAASAPTIDCTVCPAGFGEYSGKSWAEIDIETLQAAAESSSPTITHTHRAAIRLAIEQKAGEA